MELFAARSAAPAHLLLADWHTDRRAVYAASLAAGGYVVDEAVDGRDALVKALVSVPSLIVTDLRLPLIDGVALCRVLRDDRQTSDVPIVVITDEARPASLERVREAGADAVLPRAAEIALVLAEVRRLIARSVDLRGRSLEARVRVQEQLERSAELVERSARHHMMSRQYPRMTTITPPAPPPALKCPLCDAALEYKQSHLGGVSEKHPEQWDEFVCERCGLFQYRHRTRKLKRLS